MPTQILMPALSPTMTEGSLVRWLKQEGDQIKSGDAIAEIETDKATMEIETADDGILGRILVAAGTQGVPVNQPIALLLGDGEDASALAPPPAAPKPQSPSVERILASPLARRLARDNGIDLKSVKGSGPRGRVVKADVERAPIAAPDAPAPVTAAPIPEASPAYTEQPLSSMRKVIARRLTEAKQTVPHFYLTVDCQLDGLLALRAQLNGQGDEVKLSVNDFIIRAVALALCKVPAANASFSETAIRLFNDVDISVAVATPNGLITPVIRHANHKGLATISSEMKALAGKARDGKLMPEDYQGGGFTISNLGMYGIRDFAAIINPPQGCILAVGAGEQRPVVKDGALAVATVMSCTLSVDHRVVDGAVGAEFLAAFRRLIEQPLTMLL